MRSQQNTTQVNPQKLYSTLLPTPFAVVAILDGVKAAILCTFIDSC